MKAWTVPRISASVSPSLHNRAKLYFQAAIGGYSDRRSRREEWSVPEERQEVSVALRTGSQSSAGKGVTVELDAGRGRQRSLPKASNSRDMPRHDGASSSHSEIQNEEDHLLDVNDEDIGTPKARNVLPTTTPRQALHSVFTSWMSRQFLSGCAVLFPLAVTVYVTWWFLTFFDNFFSPVYTALFGFKVFGLGFVTSMAFIFATGVFVSSWLGAILLGVGEWTITKLPLVKHIYSAAKQVSAAVNPANESTASFQECVLIKHPRQGELVFGFITGRTVLADAKGERDLYSIYVPTNHIYVGDIFLLEKPDIIKPNLSVREGLEIVVSVGMALPKNLRAMS